MPQLTEPGKGTTIIVLSDAMERSLMNVRFRIYTVVALLVVALSVAAAPAFGAEPAAREILVWDIAPAAGVDADTAALLTSLLAAELSKTGRSVMTKQDVEQALVIQEERQRCGDDVSCMAEIGNALGSRDAVVGTIGRLGHTWVLSLQRIDVRQVKVRQRVACSAAGPVDVLIPRLPSMAARLFPGELKQTPAMAEAVHGVAEIVTVPDGARITIDGMDSGVTPTALNMTPGEHVIVATAPDHTTVSKTIVVHEDDTTRVHMVLPPTHGYIVLSVTPPQAVVTLDDRPVTPGDTPIRLPVGTHRIAATGDGFVPHTETVTVTGPPAQTIALRLRRPGVLLVKATPACATVLLDGSDAGTAGTSYTLPPGDHDVVIHAEGYHDVLRTVEVPEGGKTAVSVNLRLKSELDTFEIWGWSLLGVSGAAAVFSGIATWQYADNDTTGWRAAMGVGWGIAGAALISSFALLVHATEEDPAEWVDEPVAAIAPAIGPGSMGAVVQMRW